MKHADLISQMTLEEKVAFCSGSDYWHTASIERLAYRPYSGATALTVYATA